MYPWLVYNNISNTVPFFGFSARTFNGSEEDMSVTAHVIVVNNVSAVFSMALRCQVVFLNPDSSTLFATADGEWFYSSVLYSGPVFTLARRVGGEGVQYVLKAHIAI